MPQHFALDHLPTVGLVCVILGALLYHLRLRSQRGRLPPGPRRYPVIGNLLDLRASDVPLFLKYFEFGKIYGGCMSFVVGERTTLVIQDDGTAIRELFDKRGAKYSQRPRTRVSERIFQGLHLVTQRDHERWRKGRKLMVQHFSVATCQKEYVWIQDAEGIQLLYDFLHKPHKLMEHPMRYATSALTSITYGIRGGEYSEIEQEMEELMAAGSATRRPHFSPPLDEFPIFMWLPDYFWPWRRAVDKIGDIGRKLYAHLARLARDRAKEGKNINSFANKLYATRDTHKLSEIEIHLLCGLALEGGSDVVANSILACCMALINNPDVQRKAHAELDDYCGEDYIPTWKDERKLPYIRMLVKETLRWRPPFPMGVAHALDEDDEWGGYFMPKGSTVIANVWGIHMNPDRYPNPSQFIPERFVSHKHSMTTYLRHPDPLQRDHFAFGGGRRSCPGVQLAEQGLFIGIAKLLWAFEFTSVDGLPIDDSQETAFVGGSGRRPKPFKMVARPRSAARVATIEREMQRAKETLFPQFE